VKLSRNSREIVIYKSIFVTTVLLFINDNSDKVENLSYFRLIITMSALLLPSWPKQKRKWRDCKRKVKDIVVAWSRWKLWFAWYLISITLLHTTIISLNLLNLFIKSGNLYTGKKSVFLPSSLWFAFVRCHTTTTSTHPTFVTIWCDKNTPRPDRQTLQLY